MLVGDPAQLPDFDAAELTSPQQAVHLVAADLQDLCDLLDCVCLQGPHLLGLWLALVRGRLLSCWLRCVLVRSFVHVHVCTPIRADARVDVDDGRTSTATDRNLLAEWRAIGRVSLGPRARLRRALGAGNRPRSGPC